MLLFGSQIPIKYSYDPLAQLGKERACPTVMRYSCHLLYLAQFGSLINKDKSGLKYAAAGLSPNQLCLPVPHAPHPRRADVLHGDGDAVPRLELRQVRLRFLLKRSMEEKTRFSTNRSRKNYFKDSFINIHSQPNPALVNLIKGDRTKKNKVLQVDSWS